MSLKLTAPASDITPVSWPIALIRQVRRILVTALLIGFAGATLVRLGPGFGVDEREMDTRYNDESRRAIQVERSAERNIASFYASYVGKIFRGDLGFSRSLNRPVRQLLSERLPLTIASIGYGLAGGFSLGFLLATLTFVWRAGVF